MIREERLPATNLVLVESGGSRTVEIGRYADLESARAAARKVAGEEVAFSADPDHGGWRAERDGGTLRILEPRAAARLLKMADTPRSGGTTDLEMDQNPADPDAG